MYVFKDYEVAPSRKIVYQYSETDKETRLENYLNLFEIGIYNKNEPNTAIKGDILAETDSSIYTFIDCFSDGEIDGMWSQEKYHEFSPYFSEIKGSFSLK